MAASVLVGHYILTSNILDGIDLILKVLAVVAVISAIIYGVLKFIDDKRKEISRERELYQKSFDNIVSQLTSENVDVQLSAAILLRRYLVEISDIQKRDLQRETIDVISSLLKIKPVGVLQKTLADGLGYASNLSQCDLQKTNLQDILLDNKNHEILMNKTDLFLSDLSFANLKGITGHGIIFYNAILFYARIRNCDFTNGDFRGADLNGVVFEDCILKDAVFTNAIGIPDLIRDNLDYDGRFILSGRICAKHETKGKKIFFSMPGIMFKEDELITKSYKEYLEKRGFEVIYYQRDNYPRFGQLNRVKEAIKHSTGMIAFGFKQIEIYKGKYRPDTIEELSWENKWLSTPWNEIEVGIGLSVGIPILLVHDPSITYGVFDDELSECFVSRISSREDCRKLDYSRPFQEWYAKL